MHLGSFTAADGAEVNSSPWLSMSTATIAPFESVSLMTATKFEPPPPMVTIEVPVEHPLVFLRGRTNI